MYSLQEGRSFQGGIAVFTSKAALPHGLRNGIQAIDAAVNPVVAHFQQGQELIVTVQAGGHLVDAGIPGGVLPLQNGRFGKVQAQDPHIKPHVEKKHGNGGNHYQQQFPASIAEIPCVFLPKSHILQR